MILSPWPKVQFSIWNVHHCILSFKSCLQCPLLSTTENLRPTACFRQMSDTERDIPLLKGIYWHCKRHCIYCWHWHRLFLACCIVCFFFSFSQCILGCLQTLITSMMIYRTYLGAQSVCSVFGGNVWVVLVEETWVFFRDLGKTTLSFLATIVIPHTNIRIEITTQQWKASALPNYVTG